MTLPQITTPTPNSGSARTPVIPPHSSARNQRVSASELFGCWTFCETLEPRKAAGAPTINYGVFINTVIDFVIVGIVLYLLLRTASRLTPEAKAALPKGAYVPFGGGSRTCIGMRFGQLEIKAIATSVLRRFELDLAPDYRLRIRQMPTIGPKGGLPVVVRERA